MQPLLPPTPPSPHPPHHNMAHTATHSHRMNLLYTSRKPKGMRQNAFPLSQGPSSRISLGSCGSTRRTLKHTRLHAWVVRMWRPCDRKRRTKRLNSRRQHRHTQRPAVQKSALSTHKVWHSWSKAVSSSTRRPDPIWSIRRAPTCFSE